jgi:hypothetical protein
MSNLKIWMRVPDRSTLEMWVDPLEHGEEYPWTSGARIVDGQGNEREVFDGELTPGKATEPIQRPEVDAVRFAAGLTGTADGMFHARILRPDGEVFGEEFTMPITGVNGDVVRATIGVVTLKS